MEQKKLESEKTGAPKEANECTVDVGTYCYNRECGLNGCIKLASKSLDYLNGFNTATVKERQAKNKELADLRAERDKLKEQKEERWPSEWEVMQFIRKIGGGKEAIETINWLKSYLENK